MSANKNVEKYLGGEHYLSKYIDKRPADEANTGTGTGAKQNIYLS